MNSENNKESNLLTGLRNSPLFNLHDSGLESNYKIHYLKFVLLDNDKNESDLGKISTYSSNFSRNSKPVTSVMGLKLVTHEGTISEEGKVHEFSENETFINNINNDAVDIIIQNAKINDDGFTFYKNTSPDFIYRKLIGKILFTSNLIAVNHRRGPGNYVILSKFLFDKVQNYNINDGFYSVTSLYPEVAGLKFYCSSKLNQNEFLVGRKGREDEPGLHLITSDSILINHFSESIDDAKVKLRYNLDIVEELPAYIVKLNYIDDEGE